MVFVVITCFNQLELLKLCLTSLFKQTYSYIRIVIVDDNSTDGTDKYLRSLGCQVDIVQGKGDLWWGGGVRAGYEAVKDRLNENDFVLLINCDVYLTSDCVSKLVQFLKDKNMRAIAHALTVDSKDKKTIINSGSLIINWMFFITRHPLRGENALEINQEPQKIHTVPARCLMIPKKVINIVGFIDADLFKHYGGDSDFGVRCYKDNFQPYIVPKAICYLAKDNTGITPEINYGGLKRQIKGLFSIRSSNNLRTRWRFGRNAPKCIRSFYFLSTTTQVLFAIFATPFINWIKSNLVNEKY